MHGSNDISPFIPVGEFDGIYWVTEIFLTIQGEGPYSGRRSVFIRLAGCHLRCTFCDTEFSLEKAKQMTTSQIVDAMEDAWATHNPGAQVEPPLVVITGGEPCRQPIDALVRVLSAGGCIIQIETAGTFWRDCMAIAGVQTVVSPKTPVVHPRVAQHATAYKYVIRASDPRNAVTGLPEGSTQPLARNAPLAAPPPHLRRERIFLSPCDEENEARNFRNILEVGDLALRYGYTASVQLHKILRLP